MGAAQLAKQGKLLVGLHALSDHVVVEPRRQVKNRPKDLASPRVVGHIDEELSVEFQLVNVPSPEAFESAVPQH